MTTKFRIETNDDDSVTLEVGTITARITGSSWREANRIAHLIGTAASAESDLERASRRVRLIVGVLHEIGDQLDRLDDVTTRASKALYGDA